jgi:hypothetical protein
MLESRLASNSQAVRTYGHVLVNQGRGDAPSTPHELIAPVLRP